MDKTVHDLVPGDVIKLQISALVTEVLPVPGGKRIRVQVAIENQGFGDGDPFEWALVVPHRQ